MVPTILSVDGSMDGSSYKLQSSESPQWLGQSVPRPEGSRGSSINMTKTCTFCINWTTKRYAFQNCTKVCIHIHIYVYIHMYVYMYISVCMDICMYMCTYTYTSTYTNM